MLVMQGGKLEVEATYSLPNVTTTESFAIATFGRL